MNQNFDPEANQSVESQIFVTTPQARSALASTKKVRWGIAVCFSVPLLIAMGFLMKARTSEKILDQEDHLESRIAQAEKLGYSMNPSSFKFEAVPDGQNAAILLDKYFVKKDPAFQEARKEVAQGTMADLKPMTPRIRELIARAKEFTNRPKFQLASIRRFKEKITVDDLTASVDFPCYAALKEAAKVLRYDAVYQARQGNANAAIESLLQMRKIADLMKDEPSLIEMLVNVAIQSIADRTAEEIAYHLRSDAKVLDRIAKIVAKPMPLPNMDDIQKFEYFISTRLYMLEGLPKEVIYRSSLAIVVDFFIKQDAVMKSEKDPVEAAKKIKLLAEEGQDASKVLKDTVSLVDSSYLFTPQRAASRRAMTAWYLEIERTSKGNYPPGHAPQEDPGFPGGKLIYKKTKDGFALYSTGPNKVDDKGPSRMQQDGSTTDDFGMSYPPRPPVKKQ